jgi:hypothetical protein
MTTLEGMINFDSFIHVVGNSGKMPITAKH